MRYDDDAGLVKAVLDGDKDAFAFLVERYQGAVYAYCLNQVSSEEDAKDTHPRGVAQSVSQPWAAKNTVRFSELVIHNCFQ